MAGLAAGLFLEADFADLHPAIAANPFLSFYTVASESGVLTFTWTGDDGKSFVEKANITVA